MAGITVTSNCNVDNITTMRFVATRSGTTTADTTADGFTWAASTTMGESSNWHLRKYAPCFLCRVLTHFNESIV